MSPSEFENATGLSGYAAAKLIKASQSKYYEWRGGARSLPPYIAASLRAHALALNAGLIKKE